MRVVSHVLFRVVAIGAILGAASGPRGVGAQPPPVLPVDYVFSHVAGGGPGACIVEGPAADAVIAPAGLVAARDGTIYFTDAALHLVRRLTPAGQVSTVAGLPHRTGWNHQGSGPGVRFAGPGQIVLHPDGSLLVTDETTLLRVTPEGQVSDYGPTANQAPGGLVALGPDGALFSAHDTEVRKRLPGGDLVRWAGKWGQYGSVDGPAREARFERINGLAADAAGNLYVSDGFYRPPYLWYDERAVGNTIRKISSSGKVTTLAGVAGTHGLVDGTGADARFATPSALLIDDEGNLIVADVENSAIRKVTPTGLVTTIARSVKAVALAWDPAGFLLAAEASVIKRVSADGTSAVIAGVVRESGYQDGTAFLARFNQPMGLAIDGRDRIFVLDFVTHVIRRIDPGDTVVTVAGSPDPPVGSIDGDGAAARLLPTAIAVDVDGTAFVGEWSTLRRIDAAGRVTTLAGVAETCGAVDGLGPAARFCSIRGVAVDREGTIYVSDALNAAIRKVTPEGQVTTLAGALGQVGFADGVGTQARFTAPDALAVDAGGNLFVFDAHALRTVTRDGVVTTLAGSPSTATLRDGTGPAAGFARPAAIGVGADGTLFVADGDTMRRVSQAGEVVTIAGEDSSRGCDAGPGATARFNRPSGVAVAWDGSLYVADTWNHTIRRGVPEALPPPSMTLSTPANGPAAGETRVTFVGANFTRTGTTVDFCGAPATETDVVSATALVALAPAGTAGSCAATVTTAAGHATLDGALTRRDPTHISFAATGDGSGRLLAVYGFLPQDGAYVPDDTHVAGVVFACEIVDGVPQPGTTCEGMSTFGEHVLVVADDAKPGSVFAGWSGPCEGHGRSCYFWNDGPTTVTATYVQAPDARYFAEGVQSEMFDTHFVLVNDSDEPALATMRYDFDGQSYAQETLALAPRARREVWFNERGGPFPASEFGTIVESTRPLVAERTVTWDARRFGGHAGAGVEQPATTWHFAEGATHSGFSLFYLVLNPGSLAADVEVTYLLPAPRPSITKRYPLAAGSRLTIWVNLEDPALAATDVSAVLRVLNDQPVVAERAMYLDAQQLFFGAGHESAGIASPSAEWYLAEGATGTFFDTFVLVGNPSEDDALVRVDYWLPDGRTVQKAYLVAARSRRTIWVDAEDGALADTAFSARLVSTNDVPVVVERAMWWPGPTAATWTEAHVSAAASSAGTRWVSAEGVVDLARGVETYLLIANVSDRDGRARVELRFDDGSTVSREFPVGKRSRTNIALAVDVPESVDHHFSMIVESLAAEGADPGDAPLIVVERSAYWDAPRADGSLQMWAAGTNVLATRVR